MSAQPLAVILSACRTPIGSFGGALTDVSAVDLGALVVREAIARAEVSPSVPIDVPAETVNRVCGSGLQAVGHEAEAVRIGYTELVVAGGTESMSSAPYATKEPRWGRKASRESSTGRRRAWSRC